MWGVPVLTAVVMATCIWPMAPADADVWQPPHGAIQVPIWPDGAPDMEDVAVPPEGLKPGRQSITNVTDPTITVFPPHGDNSGVAMVVLPGGGFRTLAMDIEGTEICDWVTGHGITCVLLKYRVPGSDDYWDTDCQCRITPKVRRALQDTQRSLRLVRAQAANLGVDPDRIGVIGFSAGGFLAAEASNMLAPEYLPVDAADRESSRPDFAIAAFPGHMCWGPGQPRRTPFEVTAAAPPTFLVHARDDETDPYCNSTVYAERLEKAGVPVELHLFDEGGHAFSLRRPDLPVGQWPDLALAWLKKIGMLP